MPFHPFGILLNTLPNGNYTIFHRFQKKQETAVVDSTSLCMDYINKQLDVSKNKGTRKWMAYDGKPLLKWMIWGYIPLFSETSSFKDVLIHLDFGIRHVFFALKLQP